MKEHITRAIKLVEESDMILKSVTFTHNQINQLPEELSESQISIAISLMGKLKFDYMELKKLEKEHNILREEVNAFYKNEVMKPFPIIEDFDFGI